MGSGPVAQNIIRIRPYPKIIFFYPTVIAAGIYSLMNLFSVDIEHNQMLNLVFMAIFSINILVFAFDFSVLMTIIILIVVVLGSIILYLLNWFAPIGGFLGTIRMGMNAHFYYYFFLLFFVVYLLVYFRTRFNYWDISNNEIFHKTGFLSDTRRINAPNLSYTKEISDVLEFILLGAGRIKLIPLNSEPYVIETVIGIWRVDKRLAEILSKMKVMIDQESGS